MSNVPRVVLVVLDGFGERPETEGNAVRLARMPTFAQLYQRYPHVLIGASGNDVGLPEGQMGDSEVGHLNLGAGRIVYQDITRISKSIRDGDFFENPALKTAMATARKNNSSLHLMGLLSDGGVHSHINHILAMFDMAREQGLSKVFFHAFL